MPARSIWGTSRSYVEKNYSRRWSKRRAARTWKDWADIIWMYQALYDPQDARQQFDARIDHLNVEAGNSKANTYQWICSLSELGQVDATITADYPLYAVFKNGQRQTYCIYNMGDKPAHCDVL